MLTVDADVLDVALVCSEGMDSKTRSLGAFYAGRRFEIHEQIGAGSYGIVFEAFDRELEMPVALKTLRRPKPSAVRDLKREFRALSDVRP